MKDFVTDAMASGECTEDQIIKLEILMQIPFASRVIKARVRRMGEDFEDFDWKKFLEFLERLFQLIQFFLQTN